MKTKGEKERRGVKRKETERKEIKRDKKRKKIGRNGTGTQ